MVEFSIGAVLCFTFILVYLLLKWTNLLTNKRYPKGPIGFPIVGHLPLFGSYPPTVYMKWWKSYGDLFSIRMGSWNTVVVNGYSAIKAAAELPEDAFSGRPNFVSMQVLAERHNEDSFAFGNFTPAYMKQKNLAAKALRLFTSSRPEVVKELVSKEANTFADMLINKYGTVPGYIEFDVQTLVTRVMYQFLYGREKYVDVEKHVKVIVKSLQMINEFSGSGSPIDVMPWLRYVMPWKIDTFRKLMACTDDIMWKQVREHYETFSPDEIRDVADAILASDAEDEENKDKYALTRSRLNMTLSDLQGAGFVLVYSLIWRVQ